MTDSRINTALAGPDSSPTPIIQYEYEDGEGEAVGQILDVSDAADVSDAFGFNEVRIQVSVDTHYWIGANPAVSDEDGKMDILFAGILYHEIVDPAHKIAFVSADGSSEGKLFIRPVKRLAAE